MRILLGLVLCFSVGLSYGATVPLRKLTNSEQGRRLASDLKAVEIYRDGLETTTSFAVGRTNLFTKTKLSDGTLPVRNDKESLWQAWKSYLDYYMALDAIERYHHDALLLSGKQRQQSFAIGYAAFLAKYRFGLELIDAAKTNPLLDTILNDAVPELGLPAGTYGKMKFRLLNVAIATEFAAKEVLYKTMKDGAPENLAKTIDTDSSFIWRMGRGQGEVLTAKNALKVLQKTGNTAWLPVQTGVAEWMGDTKVYRKDRSLISSSQLEDLVPRLQPGDVFLIRHEWYLSNIGLPGFWPHAALYIGTAEERRQFFDDPEVIAWAKEQKAENFEALLKASSPVAYQRSLELDEKKHAPRVLEAISEGVSFTAIQHAGDADSMVVLRPKVSKKEKAVALLRAFHYAGRPYDFNFDFATDAELVCSELVYKSYEPDQTMHGLRLPLVTMLGRLLLPPNEIVRQFDSQYGTSDAQFDFVTFLDGYEREGKAKEATVDEFRQSWRRPKWHVLVQEARK